MITTDSEFVRTHSRTDGPSTSRDAARAAVSLAQQHGAAILSALQTIAPQGATVCRLSDLTGLEKHAIFRRLSELERVKAASWFGTEVMKSGREGRVWFAGVAEVGAP